MQSMLGLDYTSNRFHRFEQRKGNMYLKDLNITIIFKGKKTRMSISFLFKDYVMLQKYKHMKLLDIFASTAVFFSNLQWLEVSL